MKLLFPPFAALMVLGSPVHAAESISFVIGGHRIRIEAPRHCTSASCVSLSIPGIYERRGRDRMDGGDRHVAAPAAAPVQASAIPPAGKPSTPPVACLPPSPPVRPVAAAAQMSAPPPQAQIPPPQLAQQAAIAPPPPPIAPPVEVARPVPDTVPRVSRISHEVDEEPADTPLGDWQTEGRKGMVRLEPCGQALCGYVLDPSTNAKGETVLVDMKSKTSSEWSGTIYSRDSGNIYYGTMAMKGPNSLRVEACVLGRFFCSGNIWSRADIKPARLITDRGISLEPRS
jgi:Uncharacterized protein conserved in bacteria (DUF2147)